MWIHHATDPEKALSFISNLFFIFYLVLSIFFYRERLFGDAAFYLVKIINNSDFNVEHGRYGALITQLPVLLAVKCDLSIVRISQIFSVSYVLFYYLIFAIVRYVYRNTTAAFLVVLLLTLGVGHTFFWVVDELSQALAFSILYYAGLSYHDVQNRILSVANYAVLIGVFSLAIINHPLNVIVILYIVMFDMVVRRRISAVHLMSVVLCFLYIIWKKFFGSPYEAEKMVFGLSHINFDYVYRLALLITTKYIFHIALLAVVSICYIRKREYEKLIFVMVGFWGYVVLINITEKQTVDWFYTEHLYLPLTIIVSMPFLIDLFPNASKSAQFRYVGLCLLIVACSLFGFISLGRTYENRLNKMKNLIYQSGHCQESKFSVDRKNYFEKDFWNKEIHLYWSFPSESIMQTALDGRPKTLIFDKDLAKSIPNPKARSSRVALAPWYSVSYKQLNQRYFPFKEGYYIDLNTKMDLSRLNEQFVRNISIQIPNPPTYLKSNRMCHLEALVTNHNDIPLRSALINGHMIRFGYHWEKDDSIIVWDGLRTPLEVDIYGSILQKIRVFTPKAPGQYTLVVDIVAESWRWFHIDQKVPILID